jgi:hypothetical protein
VRWELDSCALLQTGFDKGWTDGERDFRTTTFPSTAWLYSVSWEPAESASKVCRNSEAREA